MSGRANDADAAPRQRTNTLRRSCEACRNVKARCIVEPTESTGRARCCKRCATHGIECVFENALARPKKLKYAARTRVRDVEEKLNGLLALLSARKDAAVGSLPTTTTTPAATALSPYVPAPPQASLNMSAATPLGMFPAPMYVNYDLSSLSGLGSPRAALTPATSHVLAMSAAAGGGGGDVIDRGLLPEQTASEFLSAFMLSSEKQFPFVLLPAYATVGYMRRERPFALLAILTVMADTALQMRLALEYRKTLAQAMIVESKNSLDLLQSILIFCVWHHEYFAPYNSQLYQLSQMAVTMAVEINLPSAAVVNNNNSPPPPPRRSLPTHRDDVERARTFLGTYCLSASIVAAHKKPTHFRYDRRMDQACQFLAAAQDRPSDTCLLPLHVQMRKLTEDVHRVFGTADPTAGGSGSSSLRLDAAYIETMVKDFERQYEQLRLATPPALWENGALRCAMLYVPVVIYEVALRIPPEHNPLVDQRSSHHQSATTAACCNWCASSARLALLIKCIAAAQAYITCYLDLPLADARRVTILDVSSHVDAVLTLSRVALGFDTKIFAHSSSSSSSSRRPSNLLVATDIGRYVAASQRKMAALVAVDEQKQNSNNLFWQLQYIFGLGLAWFNKRVNAQSGGGGGGGDDTKSNNSLCELAKLDGSPIDWISKGASMVLVHCGERRPSPSSSSSSSLSSSPAELPCGRAGGPSALDTSCRPTAVAQDVVDNGLLQSLQPTATTTAIDPLATSADAALPTAHMITPESDGGGGGFGAGSLDAGFGDLPPWSMDPSTELFASMPPSSMPPPWFPF